MARVFTEEERKIIGKKIKYYRENRGWTQTDFVGKSHKSVGWISKIESGSTKIKIRCDERIIESLAQVLEIPSDWLLPESPLKTKAEMPELTQHNCMSIAISSNPNEIDDLVMQLNKLSAEQLTMLRFALMKIKQ